MFKRTVDFLQQLVGGSKKPSSGKPTDLETQNRRVRVRFPSNVQVQFQAVNGSVGSILSGRVRDISQNGINLLIARPFKPGELLSIELPGTEGQPCNLVLACVVHATAQNSGEWAIGCTFSKELSDKDLEPFGAKREKPASPDDSRTWVRFPCQVTALCQEVAAPRQAPWPVQVLNISANGVGVVVERPIEPGTLLTLDLHRGGELVGQTILACVVHVTPQSDGSVALGCNFIRELSDEELKALL